MGKWLESSYKDTYKIQNDGYLGPNIVMTDKASVT